MMTFMIPGVLKAPEGVGGYTPEMVVIAPDVSAPF